jgi:hypothetical protein
MPADVAIIVTAISVTFVIFAGVLLYADMTWSKSRK